VDELVELARGSVQRWAEECAPTGAFGVTCAHPIQTRSEELPPGESDRVAGVGRAVIYVLVPRATEGPMRLELHLARFGAGPWALLIDDGYVWKAPFEVPVTLQMAVLEVMEETLDVQALYARLLGRNTVRRRN
jgi:hypothetical protein